MKVAIVSNSAPPYTVGGAEKSALYRAKALEARGHKVKIFSIHPAGTYEEHIILGVSVSHVPSIVSKCSPYNKNRNTLQKIAWRLLPELCTVPQRPLREKIAQFAPDIVNTVNLNGIGGTLVPWLIGSDIKVIHTHVDFSSLCAKSTMFRNGNCSGRCMRCRFLSNRRLNHLASAHLHVFISEFLKKRTNFYYKFKRERVIYNSFSEEPPVRDQGIKMRKHDTVCVGYIGQIIPEKGVDTFLAAAKMLKGRNDLHFLVAGHLTDYSGMFVPQENVSYLGWQPSDDFYKRVDIVVVPSRWREPLGRIPIEASIHDVVVVAADRGGLSETLTDFEKDLMFDPDDLITLVRSLEKAISVVKSEQSMIVVRRQKIHIRDVFDPNKIAEQYEACFHG